MKKYLIGLSIGLSSLFVSANETDTASLIKVYQQGKQGEAMAFGFVFGVMDANNNRGVFCIDDSVNKVKLTDEVLKAMAKAQSNIDTSIPAHVLLTYTFKELHPCSKRSGAELYL